MSGPTHQHAFRHAQIDLFFYADIVVLSMGVLGVNLIKITFE